MPIQRAPIFGAVRNTGNGALISPCLGKTPVCLGSWMLATAGTSAFWPVAWRTMACFLPPAFLACVTRIASRLSRLFQPCRQQLQIEKIHSLDSGRGHQFHLLEGDRKATSRCSGGARTHVGASGYTILSCPAQSRHLKSAFHGRDQTKIERFDSLTPGSLSLRPFRPCRGFPSRSILDFARNDKICTVPLLPKMIDILFNSFTCDAVPGLSGSCRTCSARLIPTEQILWRKNRSKRRSRTSSSSNSA